MGGVYAVSRRVVILVLLVIAAVAFVIAEILFTGSCDSNTSINETLNKYYAEAAEALLGDYDNRTLVFEFEEPSGYAVFEPVSFYVRYRDGVWTPESMDTGKVLGWLESVYPGLARYRSYYPYPPPGGGASPLLPGSLVYGYMWNYTLEVPAREGCRAIRFVAATSAEWRLAGEDGVRTFFIVAAFYDEEGGLVARDAIAYNMGPGEGGGRLLLNPTIYPGCNGNPPLHDADGDGVVSVRVVVAIYTGDDPGPGRVTVGVYALGYLEVLPCR